MKRIATISAGLLSVAAAACSDPVDNSPADRHLQFTVEASAADTRTQWGEAGADGYDIEWCADDRIAIVLSSADNMAEAAIAHLSDDRLSASFDVDMHLSSTPAEYRIYACCPASVFDRITTETDCPDVAPCLEFTVPVHQCPSERSFDPAAAVIFGSSESSPIPQSSIALSFSSIAAYGRITVKGLPLSEGERVESVTLAASQPISGAAVYHFDEAQPQTVAAPEASHTLEIEYPTDSGTFSAWFAAIPASLRDGMLCVCVKTDRGRYEKMIDMSGREFVFEQNRILSFTVDMSSTRLSVHPLWHRISSSERISDRPHIIVCNGSYCSNSSLTFDGHPQAVPLADAGVTIDGDCLYGAVDDSMKWDFATSVSGETVISRFGEPDVRLYAANTTNGIYVGADAAERSWRFSIADGAMRAVCNTRYLGITTSGWRSYTSYNNANYISSAIELFGLLVE